MYYENILKIEVLNLQQMELLRMRNEIVLLFYVTAIFAYGVLIMLNIYSSLEVLIGIMLLLLLPLLAGKVFNIKPVAMQWVIIISGNMAILYPNIISFSLPNFISFIFFILLMTIYQSIKLNTLISIISLLEIIALSFYHRISTDSIGHFQYIETFVFVIVLLTIIGWIQSRHLQHFWYRLNEINSQKKQELLSQEAYLHLFFQHANDCIAVFSLDNRIIDVNPAFEEVYGWTRAECVGKTIPLVPPENVLEAEQRYASLLEGKSFKLIETQDMRKDGTVFDVEISLSPIYDRTNKMIAVSAISRDISYKKVNEQLLLQSEKLKLAGEIAAGVAHEIRNPMAVISGFVQMMSTEKDSTCYAYTEIIQSEIERINLIIGEFLVLSKPHVEQLKVVSIDEVINNISQLFHLEFQKHNITFSMHIVSDNNRILANENQLKQVFINIIKNAIEAIEAHTANGEIIIYIAKDAEGLNMVTITDNGVGMSEALIKRVYEPFYTTKSTGTGLGMLITNKIIQEHGGTIAIESKINCGTTIKIKLPQAEN
ncbi:PAS domain S-box protein [Lysinibacillus varians]|uniref:histidine kinase n=3 Tax=Bacillaceae TaxID=186817 RepID=A0ABY2TDX5_9BACI|nr:PAS domain S-box protein [Lysinibacillus tabacifolii]TKI66718.1 PAS domain S-box protein [Lysinibacillus varians]